MWPHRQEPTRLPCPWDSPGKNTGVGCHLSHLLITLGIVDWGDNPCRCFHCSKIHRATEFIPVVCCDVQVGWPANRSKETGNDEPTSQDQAQLCFSEYTSYLDTEPWHSQFRVQWCDFSHSPETHQEMINCCLISSEYTPSELPVSGSLLTLLYAWPSQSLFKKKKSLLFLFIYLAVPGLICGTWDLQSWLQHVGSLVAVCRLLVEACGILFPWPGIEPRPSAMGV